MAPPRKVEAHVVESDEIIVVTLPREDYEIMRDMINKQRSLNWFGKYARTVLFVFAGGMITLFTFWDLIVTGVKAVLGLGPK